MLTKEVMKMASSYPRCEAPERGLLLEQLQGSSVTMLKAATTAMAFRSPETKLSLAECAGGCLAFSGTDVPLTRAIGVGTAGRVSEDDVDAVESFYRSRNSPVRIVVSERTDPRLRDVLRSRGYNSDDFMQNWWIPLERTAAPVLSPDIEVVPAGVNQAEAWVRTVAAGFGEENSPVDEAKIPLRVLDTFYCLGFADGAQPFFAKHKGVIAGGGVLHVTAETAFIRTTSCRIEHRNQGVQRALMAFRLDAAARAGCRFAFSSTDKPGPSSRNLRRFGFIALSTSFTMSS
jgi:hypothetical protein